jgi:hypothetical protein
MYTTGQYNARIRRVVEEILKNLTTQDLTNSQKSTLCINALQEANMWNGPAEQEAEMLDMVNQIRAISKTTMGR